MGSLPNPIKEVGDLVRDVQKNIGNLPDETRKALMKNAPLAVEQLTKHGSYVRDGMRFVGQVTTEIESKLKVFDDGAFRKSLKKFFMHMEALAGEVPRLITGSSPSPQLGNVSATLIDVAPKVMLLPLHEALANWPSWDTMPEQILSQVRELPSAVDVKKLQKALSNGDVEKLLKGQGTSANAQAVTQDVLDVLNFFVAQETKWVLYHLRVLIQFVRRVIQLIEDLAPRDLTIHVTVAAGGGTEVCSHPAKWLPITAKLIFDLLTMGIDYLLEIQRGVAAARAAANGAAAT